MDLIAQKWDNKNDVGLLSACGCAYPVLKIRPSACCLKRIVRADEPAHGIRNISRRVDIHAERLDALNADMGAICFATTWKKTSEATKAGTGRRSIELLRQKNPLPKYRKVGCSQANRVRPFLLRSAVRLDSVTKYHSNHRHRPGLLQRIRRAQSSLRLCRSTTTKFGPTGVGLGLHYV